MQEDAQNIKGKNVVNDDEFALPPWFHEECSRKDIFEKNPMALSILLNGSRQDVYSALSLYQVHLKFATTIAISMLTIVGAIFSILKGTDMSIDLRIIEIGIGVFMLVACFISLLSVFVITRYYNVYVSALLYGAQVHFAAKMAGFHWFMRIIGLLHKDYMQKPDISRAKFISKRTWSGNDSHLWYVVLLSILSGAFVLIAFVMWIFAPLSS